MAGQGCVNEGSDTRKLGWLICPLQRLFSWRSGKGPSWIVRILSTHHGTLYVSFGIAWPPYIVWQSRQDKGKFGLRRFGFRYDMNWKGYIFPTAAWKNRLEKPMEKGY